MDMLVVDDDIVIDSDGNLVLVTGTEAIAQHIVMRLKGWQGESVYNEDFGVPYTQVIFAGNYNAEATRFIISNQVLQTPGVTNVSIDPPEFDADTGGISIQGSATTIDGDVNFAVEVTA